MIDSSDDQSTDALTNTLIDTLKKYKVIPEKGKEKLIGQSYDGAPSMSGELSGVQKQVQDQFPICNVSEGDFPCKFLSIK